VHRHIIPRDTLPFSIHDPEIVLRIGVTLRRRQPVPSDRLGIIPWDCGFTFEVQQLGWEEGADPLSRAGRMFPRRLIAPYGSKPATSQRQRASARWRECMCRSVQRQTINRRM